MGQVHLLDCTLRDGGYLNNWAFGSENIREVTGLVRDTGVSVVEMGFMRDEPYDPERAVWNDAEMAGAYIPEDRGGALYAVMTEVFNQFPLDKLAPRSAATPDVIRVIVWKRLLPEALEYCRGIVERGYRLCVQPDRVNQYTYEEFQDLIRMFSVLDPMAVYVVDSNGFLCKKELMGYLRWADEAMPAGMMLGYHGHNSMQQTIGAAESFVEMGLKRDILIDGSVMGIGRSSGNLSIELIAKYLNENEGAHYDISRMIRIYEEYIAPIQQKTPWGYTMESYLTSLCRVNPNYGPYLSKLGLKPSQIERVLRALNETDKVIFNRDGVESYIRELGVLR